MEPSRSMLLNMSRDEVIFKPLSLMYAPDGSRHPGHLLVPAHFQHYAQTPHADTNKPALREVRKSFDEIKKTQKLLYPDMQLSNNTYLGDLAIQHIQRSMSSTNNTSKGRRCKPGHVPAKAILATEAYSPSCHDVDKPAWTTFA